MGCYKPVQTKPLSGLLELRALPEEVPYGGYRWVENIAATSRGKVCRRPGYERLLSETNTYNNQDLHHQLFESTRQPISLLFEAVSTTGVHRLIAATQNRIYALNDSTGNWRVLSDTLGGPPLATCTDRQWKAAQVEDTVVFTNGLDQPVYWPFDGAPSVTHDNQSVFTISDLDTLKVSRASVVASWKGLMFVANVVADGVRINNRIMWSDFRRPLSFLPAANSSLAGTHDLGYGEDILAALPLGDSLLFYTTRGIWECQIGDPEGEVLTFRQRYSEPRTGYACLAYRNTLISTGDEHLYFGKDGIYTYNMYTPKPIRVEWMHSTSETVFSEIDAELCNLQIGGWNAQTQEAWFSWTKQGDACPYRTLVLNKEYQFADIIQRGFTAFLNFRPSNGITVRDFLLDNCLCTADELGELGDGFIKEGQFCEIPDPPVCSGTYTSLFSTESRAGAIGEEIENWAASADAGSFYTALGEQKLDDLCALEQAADECNAAQRFVMASAHDWCLKQYGGVYAHERCTNFIECGTYAMDGYDSILRSGPIDFKNSSNNKWVNRFAAEIDSEVQTIPSEIVLRMGYSHQATDPNDEKCAIMWQTMPAKQLTCASPKTAAQHTLAKTQPYYGFEWPVFVGGRFIYWELKVSGTGGASCYSSVTMDLAVKQKGV